MTHHRKAVEVEVVRWDGGPENAREIETWAEERAIQVQYRRKPFGPMVEEWLTLNQTGSRPDICLPGDWLVWDGQDVVVVGPSQFEHEYEEGT